MNPNRRRVVVMSGGPSAEREVSLRSGQAVSSALKASGFEVLDLDPSPGSWKLPSGTDAVFLALHGTYGEDGTIQEELEALDVPYTGCDSKSSRIAFDKILTKAECRKAGVPLALDSVVRHPDSVLPAELGVPVVLKPARQGSSVGLQFVERVEDWPAALTEALRFDSEVLVEEKVVGRETTVAILDGRVLPVVEIVPKLGSYDYTNKYTPGRTDYLCPAPFSAEVTGRIQSAALAAFRAVGGRDYARVDVLVRADGSPVVLEVNTLPGMTETSLFPKAAAAAGMSFAKVCVAMLELALKRGRFPVGAGN